VDSVMTFEFHKRFSRSTELLSAAEEGPAPWS